MSDPKASEAKLMVVVGAGPGLSSHTAQRFAREGFHVALLSRNESKAAGTIGAIKAGCVLE